MDFAQRFDNSLDTIQAVLLSFLVKLGPFFVALMPALFVGYAILHTFKEDAGYPVALFFALVVSLAIETVGIVATHTTIELYNGKEDGYIKPVKFGLMAAMVPVYVIGVAVVIGMSEAFTPLVQGLGIVSPFLTCVVYIAVALARDLHSIKLDVASTKQNDFALEQDNAEHKQTLELEELRLSYALKQKKAEERARVQIEASKAKAVPAQLESVLALASTQTCLDCSKEFETVQALNAHKRWCAPAEIAQSEIPTNGNHRP